MEVSSARIRLCEEKIEMKMPWFRLYHRMIDDEKLRLLAFEDRWHFVAPTTCKAE